MAEKMSPEERDELHRDLAKLDRPFLIDRYKAIYKRLMGHKGITSTEAHIFAVCEVISENNSRLLSLLEDMTEKKLPS